MVISGTFSLSGNLSLITSSLNTTSASDNSYTSPSVDFFGFLLGTIVVLYKTKQEIEMLERELHYFRT